MLPFNSGSILAKPSRSNTLRGPRGRKASTPSRPSRTRLEKNGRLVTEDATYAHTTTSGAPPIARRHSSPNCAAAAAMDSVALPAPAFASTTSVPPFWMRLVSLATSSALSANAGVACESSGRIVAPAWPPMTGTWTAPGGTPTASARKVLARTTSRWVTPSRRAGSYTPRAFSTSATMGTVEFTGLEMMLMTARGHTFATPSARVLTMPALVLKRSSRVMPGLRGTPAGMITSSAPSSASSSAPAPTNPRTLQGVST
mmetsp:Transcript_9092/g.18826  ORF Transcript_9092/g.18826 Transcript_9092/m.18826 type:complete len:258 (+) Transcript_9092:820-1593(+)